MVGRVLGENRPSPCLGMVEDGKYLIKKFRGLPKGLLLLRPFAFKASSLLWARQVASNARISLAWVLVWRLKVRRCDRFQPLAEKVKRERETETTSRSSVFIQN